MNMLNSNDHPGKTFFFAKPEIRHNNIINWDWVENAWPDSGSLFLNVRFAILMYGLICPLNTERYLEKMHWPTIVWVQLRNDQQFGLYFNVN